MTAQPVENRVWPQPALLTVGEYLALGETEPGYTELVEGVLVHVPSPKLRHGRAATQLLLALGAQLPDGLLVFADVDVDLRLAPADAPGFVRRPDLVVVHRAAYERVDDEDGVLVAADVVLAVEIVSPGSRRTDRVVKRDEYADAGIPHYWIVDLDAPVSVLAHHLAGDLGYSDGAEFSSELRIAEPFPFALDLETLR